MTSGAIATLCLLMGTAPEVVQFEVMNAWFLHTYLPEVRQIESVYSQLSMGVTIEPLAGPEQGTKRHARYRACDGCYRVDARHEPFLDQELVLIAGHDVSAAIWQEQPGSEHRPCRINRAPRESIMQQIRVVMPIAFAPWYWYQHTIEELFLQENVTITGFSVTRVPGLGRVCRVSWDYLDQGWYRQGGEFCFAMDRSWALVSVLLDLDHSTCLEARYTYDDAEIAGVPVIRSAEYCCESSCGRALHKRMTRTSFALMCTPSDIFDPGREQIESALLSPVAPANRTWSVIAPALIGLGAFVIGLQAWRRVLRQDGRAGNDSSRRNMVPAPAPYERVASVSSCGHGKTSFALHDSFDSNV